jgi:hypothetical protein
VRTNFVITPFVALIPHPYPFEPNPREVAAIFSVPLAALEDPAGRRMELLELDQMRVPVTTVRYEGHMIWGATERISRNLVEVLGVLDDSDKAS